MARFHKLQVKDVRKETGQSISIGLAVPQELKQDFEFTQGQYLTLKLNVKGEELRRSYSICSSPLDMEEMRIAVKQVEGGRASTKLVQQLKAGDEIEVMTPMGNFFTELDPSNKKHYVAFAAGSGITPIQSILTTVMRVEPESKFTLFYGNTDKSNIIFKDKLEELNARYGSRLNVHHVLSQVNGEDTVYSGRIDKDKAAKLLELHVTDELPWEFFVCGPEQMMVNVSEALEAMGVDKKNIHVELFSTPVEAALDAAKKPASGTLTGMAKVKVILDGDEVEIDVDPNGDAILDAAMDAGMDVPYACKGAVCCTCKAKVIEGRVEMDNNYALTDGEVEEGYVLTCQSHPRSERVVVDYDQP